MSNNRSVKVAVEKSKSFTIGVVVATFIWTMLVIFGDVTAWTILSGIPGLVLVHTLFYFDQPKTKPLGTFEQRARYKIAQANLPGRYEGLAESLAARLGELESEGPISKYGTPDIYEEAMTRVRLLDKVIERNDKERAEAKVIDRTDIIQAELLGFDLETVTESNSDEVNALTGDHDKVVPNFYQEDFTIHTGDGREFKAGEVYRNKANDKKIKDFNRVVAKYHTLGEIDQAVQASQPKRETPRCILCSVTLIGSDPVKGYCRPCHNQHFVKTVAPVAKNVQTQAQVDRRNARMWAADPSKTLDRYMELKSGLDTEQHKPYDGVTFRGRQVVDIKRDHRSDRFTILTESHDDGQFYAHHVSRETYEDFALYYL